MNLPAACILRIPAKAVPCLHSLLRSGVGFAVQTEASVWDFLTGQLGLSPDYVQTRIRTIFLDGHPLDDLRTARIGDGATLALGAAMPGLVGITMACGSPFASFRDDIGLKEQAARDSKRDGRITLKLFNLVTEEIAEAVLAQGIYVSGARLAKSLKEKEREFIGTIDRKGVSTPPVVAEDFIRPDEFAEIGEIQVKLRE